MIDDDLDIMEDAPEKISFTCNECNYQFKSKSKLNYHILLKHKGKYFTCNKHYTCSYFGRSSTYSKIRRRSTGYWFIPR